VYSRGNVHDIRLLDAIDLHERRHLLDIGEKQPEYLHGRRHLLDFRLLKQIRMQLGGRLLAAGMDDAKQVFPEGRNLDLRCLDRGRLDRGHVDARRLDRSCMDARSSIPQKLVRLYNRPWTAPTYQAAYRGQCV
jgi:hypothetical protein